jgi:ATP-dependent exoDNAse (exonuclease V) beta subunit
MATSPDRDLADSAARRRALDTQSSFIVQAPAGSGKTELLIRRYLALLATVERPESVLAITFTRKAAAEMRNRVLEALRRAQVGGADPTTEPTLELARAALETDSRRGWGVLDNPSRLRILTIDALNVMLAQRLPLLSGLGGGLAIEDRPGPLYRRAAENVHAYIGGADRTQATATEHVLRHLDNRSQTLIALLQQMLPRREDWLAIVHDLKAGTTLEQLRVRLEDARSRLIELELEALRALFPAGALSQAARAAHRVALAAHDPDDSCHVYAFDAAPPTPDPGQRERWRALADLFLKRDGKWRKPRGLRAMPADVRDAAAALLTRFEAVPELEPRLNAVRGLPGPHYTDAEWQTLAAVLHLLPLAAAELQVVFGEEGRADYPSFAAAARQALGTAAEPTDLAIALDAALRHVLVDEFQDTSYAQVRLLERLTADWSPGDGRTLFVVGDPMQSIYRFRNAEVAQFIAARTRGIGTVPLEPLSLSVNFRSSRAVVDWNNRTFDHVLPRTDDAQVGAIAFSPSVPAPDASLDGGVEVHTLFGQDRVDEATRVVDLVETALVRDPQGSVAILVAGRTHLLEIVPELQRRGIIFQATDIDPLGRRPAVLDLLALTRSLAHLADRTSWLAVLRAPWCGLRLAELHAIATSSRGSILEGLQGTDWREVVGIEAQQRVDRVVDVLLAAREEMRSLGLRDAVERAWHSLWGPATVRDARSLEEAAAYFEALSELEAAGPRTIDLDDLQTTLDDLYAPPDPTPGARVELLTVHKAKGLEFDTVIVPGLDRAPRNDDRPLVRWARRETGPAEDLVIATRDGGGTAPDALYAWLGRVEAIRRRHELRRLLYVAATRARRWLHLLGSVKIAEGAKGLRIHRPSLQTGLGNLWPALGHLYATALERGAVTTAAPDAAQRRRRSISQRLPMVWRPPAVPPGPRVRAFDDELPIVTLAPEFDWVGPTARSVGTVVHRALQRAGGSGAELDAIASARQRELYALELAELGVPAERRALAVERVLAALDRTLRDEKGRWLFATSHRDARAELRLTGRLDGEIVSVAVDRTFVDELGVRWIVDFKTSEHEGGGLEQFLDAERERYALQLARYAALMRRLGPEPVRVALYFPLLSAWREWSID